MITFKRQENKTMHKGRWLAITKVSLNKIQIPTRPSHIQGVIREFSKIFLVILNNTRLSVNRSHFFFKSYFSNNINAFTRTIRVIKLNCVIRTNEQN